MSQKCTSKVGLIIYHLFPWLTSSKEHNISLLYEDTWWFRKFGCSFLFGITLLILNLLWMFFEIMITYQQKMAENIIVFVLMKFHSEMDMLNEIAGLFISIFWEATEKLQNKPNFVNLSNRHVFVKKVQLMRIKTFTKITLKNSCTKIYLLIIWQFFLHFIKK